MATLQFDFSTTKDLSISENTDLSTALNALTQIPTKSIISADADHRGYRIHLFQDLWMRWYRALVLGGAQLVATVAYKEAGDNVSFWEVGFTFRNCYIFCIGSLKEFEEGGIEIHG